MRCSTPPPTNEPPARTDTPTGDAEDDTTNATAVDIANDTSPGSGPAVEASSERSLADAVAVVRSALAAAGTVGAVDDEVLCDQVLVLEELRRVVDVAEGARLAELDRRDATARDHGLVTHRWLAREAMLPAGVARDRVKVGTAITERFDRLGPAVEAGRISWDHARAVVHAANPRVIDAIGHLQDDLIDLAEATVFERWRRELGGVVALVDQDGGHDPTTGDTRTELRVSAILDNAIDVRGTLVGDDAATVAATIEAVADELYRRAVRDHETCPDLAVPTRTVLRARALVEICRRAMARDLHDTRPPRPEVVLVTHASEPLADVATVDGAVLVQDGTRRRLECVADWHPVVVDSLGVPLDHGRAVRFATAAQRRALAIRDGGCVYPGCDAPLSWVEAHHIDPHHHGGDTDTDRMANACAWHHHHVAHGQGWTMGITADGWTWFTSPTGHTFWGQRHGRQRTGPPPDPDAP
ncbi:MAG: DUF222 domain-containing protein [Acidimicrobiales bacterium]